MFKMERPNFQGSYVEHLYKGPIKVINGKCTARTVAERRALLMRGFVDVKEAPAPAKVTPPEKWQTKKIDAKKKEPAKVETKGSESE